MSWFLGLFCQVLGNSRVCLTFGRLDSIGLIIIPTSRTSLEFLEGEMSLRTRNDLWVLSQAA